MDSNYNFSSYNLGVSVNKSVNTSITNIGDTLIYTIVVKNNTPLPIPNIKVLDYLPSALLFNNGSVFINGITSPNATILPPNGISLNFLPPNATLMVQFSATVITTPIGGCINNIGTFKYKVMNFPEVTVESPIVSTCVATPKLSMEFTTPDSIVALGGIIPFNMKIINTGCIPLTDLIVNITIPDEFSFDPNSVIINHTPGTCVDPPNLVQIPLNFPLLPNEVVTLNFNVNILSPKLGSYAFQPFITGRYTTNFFLINSPTVSLTVGTNKYTFNQYVNKLCANKCDILTYTTVLKNSKDSAAIANVTLFDLIPCNTRLLNNCFMINNTLYPMPNPELSISPPAIPIGGALTITYSVIVNGCDYVISNPTAFVSGNGATMTPILSNRAVTKIC